MNDRDQKTIENDSIAALFGAMHWLQKQDKDTLVTVFGTPELRKEFLGLLRISTEEDASFPPGNAGYTAVNYADKCKHWGCAHLRAHAAVIAHNAILVMKGSDEAEREKIRTEVIEPRTTPENVGPIYCPTGLFDCLSKLASNNSRTKDFRKAFGRNGSEEDRERFWPGYDNEIDTFEEDWQVCIKALVAELAKDDPEKEKVRDSLDDVMQAFVATYGMVC